MAKDTKQIEQDVNNLLDVFEEIAKHNKEGYAELEREINQKSAKWMKQMTDRTKLADVATKDYDAGADLSLKISEQFVKKGALKKIMEETLVEFINKKAPELVENIRDQIGTDTSPENLDRIAAKIADKVQPETSSYPIAQQSTPSGLPIQDPQTPKEEKVGKTKIKKKLSFGQHVKKWGRAALRLNPLLNDYMDKLDDEDSRTKRIEREEKMQEKLIETGVSPRIAKSTGSVAANSTIVKLLEKIEENTRGGDESKKESIKPNRKKVTLEAVKQWAADKMVNTIGGTDVGRLALNTYSVAKVVGGGVKDLMGTNKENQGKTGNLGDVNTTVKNNTSNNKMFSFVKNLFKRNSNVNQNSDSSINQNSDSSIIQNSDKLSLMNSSVGDVISKSTNSTTTGTSRFKNKLLAMNPFRARNKETAEDKFEASKADDPLIDTLKQIEKNTNPKKEKKEKKSILGEIFGGLFGKLFDVIKPFFEGLMVRLLPVLASIGSALLPLAALVATTLIVGAAADWLLKKVVGDPGDIKTSEDARESTKPGSTLDTIQKAVGGQGLKAAADKSDVEKIQTERPTAANKKRWETRIFEQGTMVTSEEAKALKEKHDIEVPDDQIKSKAIAVNGTANKTYANATEERIAKEELESKKASSNASTVPVISSKIDPAKPKFNDIPNKIETGSHIKEELENKIDKQGTAKAIAPIINKPVTNISNNNTSTSFRLHPRNQDSSWTRYMDGRYAV